MPLAFVGFCRVLSEKTDKHPLYNRSMQTVIKDIPQEYLALKINYCRKQLEMLPTVRLQMHSISGVATRKLVVGNHKYNADSPAGEKYIKLMHKRADVERQLRLYESIWNCKYKGEPLPFCEPHKVIRSLYVDTGKRVILDKNYFDSLKNDANTKYAKPMDYPFDGILYRSAAEREIAIFYTEMGIPFKYEPEVYIKGIVGPIFPDFVPYIEELDTCKFHEHFGMKDSSSYLKITKIKYCNYTDAGLVPEIDILFTHDVEEIPFDIRTFATKLNNSVYTTMISTKHLAC